MQVLSVSEVNHQIKSLLETTFLQVSVSGEVSNCTHHSSGHIYFTLKDKDSSLKCVMFRGNARNLRFKIEEGMNLQVNGAISVYVPRGEYQLNCTYATPSGIGELTLAYEQLKKEFEKLGYFDKKLPIPKFPKRIALITSSTGAVLHDMLKIASRRWKLTQFTLFDTLVQGEGAKEMIVKNIQHADTLRFDCIVLARGGGSLEDLWAFNERIVVEAIFNAKTPIVSAIGHEPDVVLSDFASSLRAPTPSAAMELLLPDCNEWLLTLDALHSNLEVTFKKILNKKLDKLSQIELLLQKLSPFSKLQRLEEKLQIQNELLISKISHKLAIHSTKLEPFSIKITQKIEQILNIKGNILLALNAKLEAKNPNLQKKGFLKANINGKVIENLKEIDVGSTLILEDCSAKAKVQVLDKTLF
ncbi:exodeoxyribonuclease VII large subunit [Helicobacter burdigaliensis]|uniref:exodeoxyribonuclease VII large subunit n=1 Tax=Helicobacter burdigaliensis TaxID=2315334 RepID=UPI000EF65352|nr:exodeoxyribonuclease VII large subunit [Helicobacter burdigaliensis]